MDSAKSQNQSQGNIQPQIAEAQEPVSMPPPGPSVQVAASPPPQVFVNDQAVSAKISVPTPNQPAENQTFTAGGGGKSFDFKLLGIVLGAIFVVLGSYFALAKFYLNTWPFESVGEMRQVVPPSL